MKQKANIQLKGHMEFSYCSLSLLVVTEGHECLYLWITNVSIAKYFKADSTECALLNVVRINKQEKANISFKITGVVGRYHDLNTKVGLCQSYCLLS